MRVDVVIDFYRKHKLWPLVVRGLELNKECINRVIVSCDEHSHNTEEALASVLGDIPYTYLWHEHNGFGGHRCIYEGMQKATTEYVAHIDADIVLEEGSLAANLDLTEPEYIVYGASHDVAMSVKVDDFPNPPVERKDWRKQGVDPGVFTSCRDLYWIMRRGDYFAIGGHDLAYPSYGMLDYDLACRWMMEYGAESWCVGPGVGYHVGGCINPGHPIDPVNKRKFGEVLGKFKEYMAGQHVQA